MAGVPKWVPWLILGLALVAVIIFGIKGLIVPVLLGILSTRPKNEDKLKELKEAKDAPEDFDNADDAVEYLNDILSDNKE